MRSYLFKASLLLSLIVFSSTVLMSQEITIRDILNNKPFRITYNLAETLLLDGNYEEALKMFKDLEKQWPGNANLNYKIGYTYMHIRALKPDAIPYLEKAIKNVSLSYLGDFIETTAPLDAYFLLAQAYHIKYVFKKSLEYYNLYLEYITNLHPEMVDEVKFKIEKVYNAQKLVENPVSVMIENSGPAVNTPYPEYSPILSKNKDYIIFTSRRDNSTGGRKDEKGMYFEDIYITTLIDGVWQEAQHIRGKINTSDHEASISLSHDETMLFIYQDDKGIGNIYVSRFEKGMWSKPEKLPAPINSEYWETHASLSPDKQTLYFVSNRPGGFGGRDIYKSFYLGGNMWSEPENLGPTINTKYDEEAPFILEDGVTLFFSSQGHENMGGFDIFVSTLTPDGYWTTPENIGYPINTTEDDVFFYTTMDEKNAVFSTSRQRRGIGDLDINYLTIVKPKKKYISVRGVTTDYATFKPVAADITFTDMHSNHIITKISTYEEKNDYRLTLPLGKKYRITAKADNYNTLTRELIIDENEHRAFINTDLVLHRIIVPEVLSIETFEVGEKIVLNDIYFDFDKSELRQESKTELDRLLTFMTNNPLVSIEISSHTDAIGTDEYNIKLSQRRAQNIVDFLISNKIEKNRLVATGYGATKPIASNETDEGRQLNRRVEIKILKK